MSDSEPIKAIENISQQDYGRYLLHSQTEIVSVLRTLVRNGAAVTAHFNHGRDFMLTALLEVNTQRGAFVFDCGGSPEANQRLLSSEKNVFIASNHGVRIQFAAGFAKLVRFHGHSAFMAALPKQLLRLQRREFYRVPIPYSRNLICHIESEQIGHTEFPVNDISLGGLSLAINEGAEKLAILDRCHGKLNLPEIGELRFELEVRNIRPIPRQEHGASVGFCFIDFPMKAQALVQRYLTKIEQERHALRPGQ